MKLLGVAVLFCFSTQLWAAVILQYHHISDTTPAATSTSPKRFAGHLDYLAENGFEVVPLIELVQALKRGRSLPDKVVAITFDDGYSSIYDVAFPMLKSRGWPFTVFVNSQPHDNQLPNFLSWEQMRTMAAAGATIANHTRSHSHLLRRLEGEDKGAWEARVTREIDGAEDRIQQKIGKSHKYLAYPYGEYNRDLLELMERLGYTGFGQQSGPLASHSSLQALPRFPFGGRYGDSDDFAVKVNSLPLPLVTEATNTRWLRSQAEPLDDLVLPVSVDRPLLALLLAPGFTLTSLRCFASGQGQIPLTFQQQWAFAQAKSPLPVGRSRYNCTAPSNKKGRFYWYSQLWIRKLPDGSWYPPG